MFLTCLALISSDSVLEEDKTVIAVSSSRILPYITRKKKYIADVEKVGEITAPVSNNCYDVLRAIFTQKNSEIVAWELE